VTIQPDHPYTHRYDKTKGKLHLSQVTVQGKILPFGRWSRLVKVLCNVAHTENPICLCSISPDAKHKSFPLNFEFGEDDGDVVLSVIGHYDVHLAGYFLGNTGGHGEDGIEKKKIKEEDEIHEKKIKEEI
ncbi:hypothetical protein C5167_004978, partial [Papaver somniferum]